MVSKKQHLTRPRHGPDHAAHPHPIAEVIGEQIAAAMGGSSCGISDGPQKP
jgi:hypothetical protein